MPTGAELIVALLEREGVEVVLRAARRPQPRALGGAAPLADPARRRAPRAGGGLRRRRLRPRDRAGSASHSTTTGPGAANTLGAVGEAWASRSPDPRRRHRHPYGAAPPGVYRGVLHETTDQAAMFAPVVKATFTVGSRGGAARRRGVGHRDAVAPPAGPVYLQVPTDLLARRGGTAAGSRRGRATADAGRRTSGRPSSLDAAERPLIWAGWGAVATRGRGRLGLAERLAAPVITTYGAAGMLAATIPAPSACRRTLRARRRGSGTRPTW